MTNIFCVCCPLKESFRDIFVIHCPSRKKNRFRADNLASVWREGIVSLGGKFTLDKKMPEIDTAGCGLCQAITLFKTSNINLVKYCQEWFRLICQAICGENV